LKKDNFPNIRFHQGSSYDNLSSIYGKFPLIVSLEVIEHCYSPRAFAKTFYDLVVDNGIGVISTPYHGYIKNLVLAMSGNMDSHFTALWNGGHIKFFSMDTLSELLHEAGFKSIEFYRAGRIPPLAKINDSCSS
jgi:2-polyprenyl-6-hydroxyphenyl methylase/3-demethylubiquinone-9 3-methyltransferase